MGKTARWLKGLLGGKKAESPSPTANVKDGKPVKEKKRWGFVRSFRDKERTAVPQVNGDGCRGSYREGSSVLFVDGVDPNKHAIAVAAATAAVAEAAVAAAQAAAAVVRLTSSGRCLTPFGGRNVGRQEDWAAVKIQAAFRGYLARRALLALKGLVKLQALVRGHIVRKRMAEKLRCLQALVRVQARARAGRAHISPRQPNSRHSLPHHFGPATPKNFEHPIHTNSTKRDRWSSTLCRNGLKPNNRDISNLDKAHLGSNRLGHWMDERSWQHHQETSIRTGRVDDEKSDKILEVDTGEPHLNPTRRSNVFQSSQQALDFDRNSHSFTTLYSLSRDPTTSQLLVPSPSSGEVQHMSNLRDEDDDASFGTADNSPQFYSASSRPGSARRGPFTPTRSECSRSFFSGYSDYPNYMANTESSRAKVRSQSAPRQRPEFEKSGSTKRLSVHGFRDTKLSAQSPSALHAKFSNKAYPGSGRLDRFGMPIPGDTICFNGVYHNIY